jgi:signal transduction histidine kinase
MTASLRDRAADLRARVHVPRWTVRLRLTLLYGGLFLIAGVGLLAITFLLIQGSRESSLLVTRAPNGAVKIGLGGEPGGVVIGTQQAPSVRGPFPINPAGVPTPQQLKGLVGRQHAAQLHQLLMKSGIALGVMSVLSVWLGWLVAGRVLRPLQTMTAAVRSMSAADLHQRLAMGGPSDELKDLGDTFDDLLDRLEAAFEAQRQFVANASHELRTPLARQRTIGEVALRDPTPTIESLRASCERVLAAGEQQERLIEALLTLARGDRGIDRRMPVDLAIVAGELLEARQGEAEDRGLRVSAALGPAPMSGDPGLVERLVANLVDNAMRHNLRDGTVEVVTWVKGDRAVLSVTNTGPLIPQGQVERLFEPFRRLGANRTDHSDGFGLGLSIVRAIGTAHSATLDVRARSGGGLAVEVAFPVGGPTRNLESDEPRAPTRTFEQDLAG